MARPVYQMAENFNMHTDWYWTDEDRGREGVFWLKNQIWADKKPKVHISIATPVRRMRIVISKICYSCYWFVETDNASETFSTKLNKKRWRRPRLDKEWAMNDRLFMERGLLNLRIVTIAVVRNSTWDTEIVIRQTRSIRYLAHY